MWYLSSGIFLGWSLGANDAANVFGTAVASNMIRWRTAAILTAIFVVVGALLQGSEGLHTLGGITSQTSLQAFITMLAAALTVTLMTKLRLPVSTSQAVVGSIVGTGLIGTGVQWKVLVKIVACWVGTPIGAALIGFSLYYVFSYYFRKMELNFFGYDRLIRNCLICFGIYSAYALGANNVANVTGVFFQNGMLSEFHACLIGSLSIGFGVLTYSKNVMKTVGRGIIDLDSFSALITVLASAMTVHIFAIIGVPVSSSQAIVGAVIGVGFVKGLEMVNSKMLTRIIFGWLGTPLIAAMASIFITYLFRIKIVIVP